MERSLHTKAGPNSRDRKNAECLERKFEREVQPTVTTSATIDLTEWARNERGLS